jgi:hypothetical protein
LRNRKVISYRSSKPGKFWTLRNRKVIS